MKVRLLRIPKRLSLVDRCPNLLLEIVEDVMEECQKYGTIVELKIPRPSGGSRQSAGVGKIFIKYDTAESAKNALQALAGRKFADRTVVTTYFDEVRYRFLPTHLCSLLLVRLLANLDNHGRPVSMSVLGKKPCHGAIVFNSFMYHPI